MTRSTRLGVGAALLLATAAPAPHAGAESAALAPDVSARAEQILAGALADAEPDVTADDLRAHVERLASETFEGRRSGRPGGDLASAYVAEAFEALGLEPAAPGGSFLQAFEFEDGLRIADAARASLTIAGDAEPITADASWRPMAISAETAADAPIAFAGYGLVLAGSSDGGPAAFDSFGDADLSGRWVLMWRGAPSALGAQRRTELLDAAAMRAKAAQALARGAAGVLIGADPDFETIGFGDGRPPSLGALAFADPVDGPVIALDIATTDRLTALAGETAARARAGEQGTVADLDARLDAAVALDRPIATGYNALARLDLDGEADLPPVVIGAHLDHLGRGEGGLSRGGAETVGVLHLGADDNASGTAALIEIAARLVAARDAGRLRGARDIVFAGWAAEELGLIGAARYADALAEAADADDLDGLVHSYLNMDMVGALRETLFLQGSGSSSDWPAVVAAANAKIGLAVRLDADPFIASDGLIFYRAGVPILAAFTGEHPRYHLPADTADTLNYDGAAQVAALMAEIAVDLAQRETALAFVAVEPPRRRRRSDSPFIGVQPAQNAGGGVRVDAVVPGGPSEAAGLRVGDVIVELDGQPVDDVDALLRIVAGTTAGEPTIVVVERRGIRLAIDVTPRDRR